MRTACQGESSHAPGRARKGRRRRATAARPACVRPAARAARVSALSQMGACLHISVPGSFWGNRCLAAGRKFAGQALHALPHIFCVKREERVMQ